MTFSEITMRKLVNNYDPPIKKTINQKFWHIEKNNAGIIIDSINTNTSVVVFKLNCSKKPNYALYHKCNCTAAHKAAQVGNEELCNYIFGRAPDLINRSVGFGTPLIYAIENIDKEETAIKMVKLLVAKKADVNFKVLFFGRNLLIRDSTPLVIAARKNFSKLVNLLFKVGATYSKEDLRYLNIKKRAIEFGDPNAHLYNDKNLDAFSNLLDDKNLKGLDDAIQLIYTEATKVAKEIAFQNTKYLMFYHIYIPIEVVGVIAEKIFSITSFEKK